MTDKPKRGRSKIPSKLPLVTGESVTKMVQPNGGWLKVGNPGHDGSNAGRPPQELRRMNSAMHVETAAQLAAKLDAKDLDTPQLIQLHKVTADVAVPKQSESLNVDEGKAVIERTLGRFVDLVRATGLITDTDLNAMYDEALKGLAT